MYLVFAEHIGDDKFVFDYEKPFYPTVKALVEKYGIKSLVETGVGSVSSGLVAADALGIQGYGCDIFLPRVEWARARHPNAKVTHDESLHYLRTLLPTIAGPVFFWLDAHFPDMQNFAGEKVDGPAWPLYQEVEVIRELCPDLSRSVVWCDDLQVITGAEDHLYAQYPQIYDHKPQEYGDPLAATHDFSITEYVMRLEPRA